jgi:hypothetical protein
MTATTMTLTATRATAMTVAIAIIAAAVMTTTAGLIARSPRARTNRQIHCAAAERREA